jgi:hypothetical protein
MSDKRNQNNFHPERRARKRLDAILEPHGAVRREKFHRIPIDLKISDFSRHITIEKLLNSEREEKKFKLRSTAKEEVQKMRKTENCRKRKKQTSRRTIKGKVLTHK